MIKFCNFLIFLSISFVSLASVKDPANVSDKVWLNNKLGIDHEVPPPWTPIKLKGNTIEVWGREIILSGSGFPEQIINQKLAMFCKPLSLAAELAGGEKVEFSPGRLKLLEQYPDMLVFSGSSSVAGINAEMKTTVEFDGYIKFELKLSAPDSVKIKRLYLDSPLRPDQFKYYNSQFSGYSPVLIMDTWGTISKARRFKFLNIFSLSGEKLSWNWSCDGARNWRLQRRSRALEVIPSEDELILRVNFIDTYAGTEIGRDREITFAFQAGPFRPQEENYRQYTALSWSPRANYAAQVAGYGIKPLICLWPFSLKGTSYQNRPENYARASRVGFNYPWPENPEKFRDWMREFHDAKALVLPYIATDHFDLDWGPGSNKYQAEWAGKPVAETRPETTNGFRPIYGQPACYHSKSWQDFYVWLLVNSMREFDYDGYYLDNVWAKSCENPSHPKSHAAFWEDPDGNKWKIIPLLESRNFYKRIYKAIKAIKPDAMFFANGSRSPLAFWPFRLTVEYASRLAGKEQFWSDFVTSEDMKGGMFRGHQHGIMRRVLPQYSGKNISPEAARAMLAILLIGDTLNYWEVSAHSQTLLAFDKLKGDFKIWEATWVPYWENNSYLNCNDAKTYLTMYKKADSALIFISNLNNEPKEIKVSVDLDKVFTKSGKYSAFDLESGKQVDLNSNMVLNETIHMFTLPVKTNDFRAVVIRVE